MKIQDEVTQMLQQPELLRVLPHMLKPLYKKMVKPGVAEEAAAPAAAASVFHF